MADDLSLPFCQLKLQLLFNAESRDGDRNGIVDVMFKAAVKGSGTGKSHWAGLVTLMIDDLTDKLFGARFLRIVEELVDIG